MKGVSNTVTVLMNSTNTGKSLQEYGIVISTFTPSIHGAYMVLMSVVGPNLKLTPVLEMIPPQTLKLMVCAQSIYSVYADIMFPVFMHTESLEK